MFCSRNVALFPVLAALVLILVGCGSAPPVSPGDTAASGSATNDPMLQAAVDTIKPILEGSFSTTFAGLVVDNPHRQLVIYRRPDPDLETRVHTRIPGIKVVFRDAEYSLAQLKTFGDQILKDSPTWRDKGISITGVGPKPDGSGIFVFVAEASAEAARRLSRHYGKIPIMVREQQVVPPVFKGPIPTITVTAIPSKSVAP